MNRTSEKGFIGLVALLIVFVVGMYFITQYLHIDLKSPSNLKLDKDVIESTKNLKNTLQERDKLIEKNL